MKSTERTYRSRGTDLFLKIMFLFLLICAGMGEWKVLNGTLGGIPKGICVGIIGICAAALLIRPDWKRGKDILLPTLFYLALILFLMLWSLVIWIMQFTELSSVVRGGSKMIFQTISILTALSAVYLFGFEAIDLFTLGLCTVNGLIMLLEIPNYGFGASMQSLFHCIVRFGDAVGYARALEIHDLTFVFGQLILYYAVFAPKKTVSERKKRRRYLVACIFFFLVGMKRIAIPAVVLFLFWAAWMKRKERTTKFFVVCGITVTSFFLIFIYGVRSGVVSELLGRFGVNMMGRDYLWELAGAYYRFSPGYFGRGFEFVDKIVVEWYESGIINHAYPLHNDILKVFIELGFPGFLIWSLMQYLVYPIFFLKYADSRTAVLYLSILGYMTVTYLTDNTAFYFWSTMALRLVVSAYALKRRETCLEERDWRPPSKEDIRAEMASLLYETGENLYD